MMEESLKTLLTASLSEELHTLVGSEQFIFPRYEGESILNILPSVAKLLNVAGFQHPGLLPEILTPLQGDPQNIILILLDALAYHRLESWLKEEKNLSWHQLRDSGILVPLTSICPSTTSAAITSYWTDSAAVEHGILGYEMWLKEYGIIANTIEHKPITYRSRGGGLTLAGFDPLNFLPVNSITGRFVDNAVEVHAFQHYSIINSGLSEMFMGEAGRHAIATPADMWISIRKLLEAKTLTKKYIWAYWGQLDGSSHLHGPDSERAQAEFLSFSKAFETHFLGKLSSAQKKNTMVILTADHGQITTDLHAEQYDLKNHPGFMEMLHLPPTGENRLAYLHVKPGQIENVKEYIERAWPGQFTVFETKDGLKADLFGTGVENPAVHDRLGDLIVAAGENAYWWWASKPNPLIGRHGGLSAEEMLVPFLAGYL